jgi:hypothetical protein
MYLILLRLTQGIAFPNFGPPPEASNPKMENKMNLTPFSSAVDIFDKHTLESSIFCL